MPVWEFLRFDWLKNVNNQNNETVFFRLADLVPGALPPVVKDSFTWHYLFLGRRCIYL